MGVVAVCIGMPCPMYRYAYKHKEKMKSNKVCKVSEVFTYKMGDWPGAKGNFVT